MVPQALWAMPKASPWKNLRNIRDAAFFAHG